MKTKVFAIFALLLCTTMFFTGCSEEEDMNSSLNGTTWSGPSDWDEDLIMTFYFKESTFDWTITDDGEVSASMSGTYTYSPPTLTMTVEESDLEDFIGIMSVTISSDTMYYDDFTITKQ